jgi:hypothetical protein
MVNSWLSGCQQAERIFVDIEGLKDRQNKMLIKELAICKADGSFGSWILSAPYPFSYLPFQIRKQNKWITRNLHSIDWNDGLMPYRKMPQIFDTYIGKGMLVYVKGKEKGKLLEKKLPGRFVLDLEDIGCPPVDKISCSSFTTTIRCLHQHKNNRCALYKCHHYMDWFVSDWFQPSLTVTVDGQ